MGCTPSSGVRVAIMDQNQLRDQQKQIQSNQSNSHMAADVLPNNDYGQQEQINNNAQGRWSKKFSMFNLKRQSSSSRGRSSSQAASSRDQNLSISIVQPADVDQQSHSQVADDAYGASDHPFRRGLLANIFSKGNQIRPHSQSLENVQVSGRDNNDKEEPLIFKDGSEASMLQVQPGSLGVPEGELVRVDLSQNKIPQTPKNEILLMRLTEQLMGYLEQAQEAQNRETERSRQIAKNYGSSVHKARKSQLHGRKGQEIGADEEFGAQVPEGDGGRRNRLEQGLVERQRGSTQQEIEVNQPQNPEQIQPSASSDAKNSSTSSALTPGQSFLKKQRIALKENTMKVETRLDELSHCHFIASLQLSHFKRNAFFIDLQIQLMRQLRKLLKQKSLDLSVRNMTQEGHGFQIYKGPGQNTGADGDAVDDTFSATGWYFNYCKVLVRQLVTLIEPLKVIQKEGGKLMKNFLQSQEIVLLQSCLVAIIRFAEGISWGYSPMLMHQQIEKENEYCVRLVLNLLLTVRQHLREQANLLDVVNATSDVPCIYVPREQYLATLPRQFPELWRHRQSSGSGEKSIVDIRGGIAPQGACVSYYLENQVFRKTYVQIKRSIDDWLRIKNLKRSVIFNYHKPSKIEKSDKAQKQPSIYELQKVSCAKDVITIQEFVQYKLTYKSFSKNFIRNLKRPPSLDPKRQRRSVIASQQDYYQSYSSVRYTLEEPQLDHRSSQGSEDRQVNQPDHSKSYSYEIQQNPEEEDEPLIQDAKPKSNFSPKVGAVNKDSKQPYAVPCQYEIENSKQFLLLTGRSHEELRVIVESFLQANVKMRTKYKCACIHHCLLENPSTCDTYNIVKNILSQILHSVPFLSDYLKISSNTEFEDLFKELKFKDVKNDAESLWEQGNAPPTEKFSPSIFVKFIKRVNELRLDFNIVVVVTGIEYAFDQDDFQNFVYLLRSASVYLNQNSFFKFILTMQNCPTPSSPALKHIEKIKNQLLAEELDESRSQPSMMLSEEELDQEKQKNKNEASEDPAIKDIDLEQVLQDDINYQRDVIYKSYQKFQQITQILQTGAICNVEDGIFFRKSAAGFIEFALKYLYPNLYSQDEVPESQNQDNQSTELKQMTSLVLKQSEGSYHNCIQIVNKLCLNLEQGKDRKEGFQIHPSDVIQQFKSTPNTYLMAFEKAQKVNQSDALPIIRFTLSILWLSELNRLDGTIQFNDLSHYADLESYLKKRRSDQSQNSDSDIYTYHHTLFERFFEKSLQKKNMSSDLHGETKGACQEFEIKEILRIFCDSGLIQIRNDDKKDQFLKIFRKNNSINTEKSELKNPNSFQDQYTKWFEPSKKLNYNAEQQNQNFEFQQSKNQHLHDKKWSQVVNEAEIDRLCELENGILGKKVQLNQVLIQIYEAIVRAEVEDPIQNTIIVVNDASQLYKSLIEFTTRTLSASQLNNALKQVLFSKCQPASASQPKVQNQVMAEDNLSHGEADGTVLQTTLPSTEQQNLKQSQLLRDEDVVGGKFEKFLEKVTFSNYDLYKLLKWLFIIHYATPRCPGTKNSYLDLPGILRNPTKLINLVVFQQQQIEQSQSRQSFQNPFLALFLPQLYSHFATNDLLLQRAHIHKHFLIKVRSKVAATTLIKHQELFQLGFFNISREQMQAMRVPLKTRELMRPDWLYVAIRYVYKSFNRYLTELKRWARIESRRRQLYSISELALLSDMDNDGSQSFEEAERPLDQAMEMANMLYCIEQTLNSSCREPTRSNKSVDNSGQNSSDYFNFLDFLVQIRGRILKDSVFADLFFDENARKQPQKGSYQRGLEKNTDKFKIGNDEKKQSSDKLGSGDINPDQHSNSITMDQKHQYLAEYLANLGREWSTGCPQESHGINSPNHSIDFNDFLAQSCPGRVNIQNYHQGLRENQRIESLEKMPGCVVLSLKYYQTNSVIMSLSNGLIVLYDTLTQTVEKIFACKGAVIDCLKVLYPTYLITSGIDTKIRIWNIKNGKLFAKFEIHKHSTQQMIIHGQNLYSYGGHDMKLVKFAIACKETDCWINLKSHITSMKLLNYRSKARDSTNLSGSQNNLRASRQDTTESQIFAETHIAAAFHDFDVVIYDLDLNQLKQVALPNMTPGDEVIRIIRNSDFEIMCFSNEGTINVLGINGLEEKKSGTIFSLKNEDYIDLLLIKSREYFLFTIERQKIEFYSAQHLKRTDSWDYFFTSDITSCHKNREGSKIFICDKAGNCVLFNFMKHLDPSKHLQVPMNRRHDPVIALEATSDSRKKEEDHLILSCSLDRDLRIWRRKDGLFNKKYDLSSFLGENVQCIKLGKNEDNLFLGSKDMNVYLINIKKGKLCVVYEGHWNKVTQIYGVPGSDILMTISESNIKVWDLEYDECIKNMNEHSSEIIFIEQLRDDEQKVMTIGDQFELKVWNYVTGSIDTQMRIDVNKTRKELRMLQILCCDVQNEEVAMALNNNQIIIQSLKESHQICTFQTWSNEETIFIKQVRTLNNRYLFIVNRTAVLIYQLIEEFSNGQVVKIRQFQKCAYHLNAKRHPHYKSSKHSKYNNNARYYFSTAHLHVLFDEQRIEQIREKQEYLEQLLNEHNRKVASCKANDTIDLFNIWQTFAWQLRSMIAHGYRWNAMAKVLENQHQQKSFLKMNNSIMTKIFTGEIDISKGAKSQQMTVSPDNKPSKLSHETQFQLPEQLKNLIRLGKGEKGESDSVKYDNEVPGRQECDSFAKNQDQSHNSSKLQDNTYYDGKMSFSRPEQNDYYEIDGNQLDALKREPGSDIQSGAFRINKSEIISPKASSAMQSIVYKLQNPNGSQNEESELALHSEFTEQKQRNCFKSPYQDYSQQQDTKKHPSMNSQQDYLNMEANSAYESKMRLHSIDPTQNSKSPVKDIYYGVAGGTAGSGAQHSTLVQHEKMSPSDRKKLARRQQQKEMEIMQWRRSETNQENLNADPGEDFHLSQAPRDNEDTQGHHQQKGIKHQAKGSSESILENQHKQLYGAMAPHLLKNPELNDSLEINLENPGQIDDKAVKLRLLDAYIHLKTQFIGLPHHDQARVSLDKTILTCHILLNHLLSEFQIEKNDSTNKKGPFKRGFAEGSGQINTISNKQGTFQNSPSEQIRNYDQIFSRYATNNFELNSVPSHYQVQQANLERDGIVSGKGDAGNRHQSPNNISVGSARKNQLQTNQSIDSFRDSIYDHQQNAPFLDGNINLGQGEKSGSAIKTEHSWFNQNYDSGPFKILLTIGDSRGQVHMNNVYLA